MIHKIYLKLQTIRLNSRHLSSTTYFTSQLNKGYLKSMTKILIFLYQQNPVLPTVFSSPLMATCYFRSLRPKTNKKLSGVIRFCLSLILKFHCSVNLTLPSKYILMQQHLTTSTTAARIQPSYLPSTLLSKAHSRPPSLALVYL